MRTLPGRLTRTNRAEARRRRHLAPQLEVCEARTLLAAAYTVTLLTDTGPSSTGTGSGTSGDLRYCIDQADQTGGTINFTVTGTLVTSPTSPLPALASNQPIAIAGPGANALTIQGNTTSGDSILRIDGGTTVSIAGVTLTGGSASDGGAIRDYGTLTLTASTIRSNTASDAGGGIWGDTSGSITLVGSTLSGNMTTTPPNGGFGAGGGGLYSRGDVTLIASTVTGNSAQLVPRGGNLLSYGGGICAGLSDLTIIGSTISGNSATVGAGIRTYSILRMTDSTVTDNSAINSAMSTSLGGGIWDRNGGVIRDSTISGNSSGILGGAGMYTDGRMSVIDCNFSDNTTADGYGGGIQNEGTLTVTGSTFNGNTAAGGGAISVGFNDAGESDGLLFLNNSTLSGNKAAGMITTSAPSRAKAMAAARPMPLSPPVTSALRFGRRPLPR